MTTIVTLKNDASHHDVLVRVIQKDPDTGLPELHRTQAVKLMRRDETERFVLHSGNCLLVIEMPNKENDA